MPYALSKAVSDTRRILKDDTENVWTTLDIKAFINEAISMIRKTIPEYFTDLTRVTNDNDIIKIDEDFENLIPLFASARCFEQDEQNYRAVKNMNEFEARKGEMEQQILDSDNYVARSSEGVTDEYYARENDDLPLPLDP
jgi:hypothetical protein